MTGIPQDIQRFLESQGFVIVSSIDKRGTIHHSCKGIIKIDPKGKVYLLDLYKARTFENLKHNPNISISAVDEHRFIGYCLKGRAKIINKNKLTVSILNLWEEKISKRITQRILKNIKEEKRQNKHPETFLPKPEYLILMEAKEIVNLAPAF